MAYYVVFASGEAALLEKLTRVAGMRWHIEPCFESAKDAYSLDEYEIRC